jgi:hypothetical protein
MQQRENGVRAPLWHRLSLGDYALDRVFVVDSLSLPRPRPTVMRLPKTPTDGNAGRLKLKLRTDGNLNGRAAAALVDQPSRL